MHDPVKEREQAERRARQQVERRFMLTSHGALHSPNCYNLKRLKVPAKELWLGPNDPKPKDACLAACCWQYGSWEAVLYGWRYTETGEPIG